MWSWLFVQAKLRYQDAHQRATNLQFQLKENRQDQKMHKKRMERLKLANEKLVGPQTDRLRKEIGKLEVRATFSCFFLRHFLCTSDFPPFRSSNVYNVTTNV